MNENDLYLIWLISLNLSNPNIFIEKNIDIKSIFENPKILLEYGFNIKFFEKIQKSANEKEIDKIINIIKRNKDIEFISYKSSRYPTFLNNLDNKPIGIFLKGNMPNFESPSISIVGARDASQYGSRAAYYIASELSELGINIISGMALGIDAKAHEGALSKNGYTLAILGNGVDICYPKYNYSIYNYILEKGGIISEYLPETRPSRYSFPHRNRIIAAMCDSIIVVEAGKKSGALSTVDFALNLGTPVYSVPGSIFSKVSEGSNALIQEGANIFLNTKDVLDEIIKKNKYIDFFSIKDSKKTNQNKKIILENKQKIVYDIINNYEIHIDNILYKSKIPIDNIYSILIELELNGLIKKMPGNKYIRT